MINFILRFFRKKQKPKMKSFAASIVQSGYTEHGLRITNNLYIGTAISEEEFASAAVSMCLENEENRWMKIYKPVVIEVS